jgi:adenine-specific DNA methylase
MKLLSHKESKVISEKYEYENAEEYMKHKEEMIKLGFRETTLKYAPMRATYQKFTHL